MANRRCLSKAICESLKFVTMGKAAQALYMHIVLNADDDGICEAGIVMRVCGIRKTALQELVSNGFVTLIEPNLNIVWTNDWQSFNTVDTRYGQPSNYRRTMLEHFPTHKFVDFKGKNGTSPTSDTRRREEKLREEKLSRSEGNGCAEQTHNFELLYSSHITDDNIPPDRKDIGAFFADLICDKYGIFNEKHTRAFFEINSSNGWSYCKERGLKKTLQDFIYKDPKLANALLQWSAEPEPVQTKDLISPGIPEDPPF